MLLALTQEGERGATGPAPLLVPSEGALAAGPRAAPSRRALPFPPVGSARLVLLVRALQVGLPPGLISLPLQKWPCEKRPSAGSKAPPRSMAQLMALRGTHGPVRLRVPAGRWAPSHLGGFTAAINSFVNQDSSDRKQVHCSITKEPRF